MAPSTSTKLLKTQQQRDALPLPYFLFFSLVEPFLTLLGMLYAVFRPSTYFASLIPSSFLPPSSPATTAAAGLDGAAKMATRQLGSCFFLFALFGMVLLPTVRREFRKMGGKGEEGLEKVVGAYLGCLALADWTHILFTLYDLYLVSPKTYGGLLSPLDSWNQLVWGNVGITAALFGGRMMWFAGVGRGGVVGGARGRKEE